MSENTICPMISISVDDCFVPCQGERCAWYVPPVLAPNEGRLIAGALRGPRSRRSAGAGERGEGHNMTFRTCPVCGAALGPCERCDCRDGTESETRGSKEKAAPVQEHRSGKVGMGLQAQLSASSLHEDEGNCKNEPSRRT